ncbi:MAG: acyl carrier protein [bacterium]
MPIESELRRIISAVAGIPNDFGRSAHLYWELGISSAKALELLLEIEEHYGLTIPDEQFVQATSLEHLVELVSGLSSGHGRREPALDAA